MKEIRIRDEYIKLEQLLKLANIVSSGGEAKAFLLTNKVYINGELDNRRGRKVYKNDEVVINNETFKVC